MPGAIAGKAAIRTRTMMMTTLSGGEIVRRRADGEAVNGDMLDRRRQQPLNAAQQIAIRL